MVVHINPVRLALESVVPCQRVVNPFKIVNRQRPGRYPPAHGLLHMHGTGLALAAVDRDGVLVDVDGHADAQPLTRQAALARLPVALGEVCIVDVGLIHPDGLAQHDPVLVAGHRGEHTVTPHSTAAHSTGTLWRMSLMKKTQTGSGFRQCSRTAPESRGEAPAAAATHVGGLSEQKELVGDEARHEYPEGVRPSHIELSHLQARPSGGIGALQRSGWALSQIPCLAWKA